MSIQTRGVSPKLLAPLFTALTGVAVSWIATGVLDRLELSLLAAAAIGALAAYVAPPGEIAIPDLEALPFDVDEVLDDGDELGDELGGVALPGEPVDPAGPGFPLRPGADEPR